MITFLNPLFLSLFGLLIPILALYFLKSKPVRRAVPTNLLWKVVLSRVKPNSFLQRFQNSLFLILQILALSLVTLACARPTGLFGGGLNRVIILDVSGSMQAGDVSPSRFEAARNRATGLSRHSGRTALYSLGDRLDLVVPLTDQGNLVSGALASLRPTHSSTPSAEKVIRMLRDLEGLSPDEVFVLTDTLDLFLPSNFMPQTAITVETFGKESDNVAIVEGEAGLDPGTGSLIPTVGLMNNCSRFSSVTLSVEKLSPPGYPRAVTLAPNERTNLTLPPVPVKNCVITLEAPSPNNFSRADDRWFFCDPGLKPRVFLEAPRDSILFRLQKALPLVEFVPFGPGNLASEAGAFLAKGSLPPEARSLPTCSFLPRPGKVRSGEILPWEGDHPILKYLNWDEVPPEALNPGELPGIPLVESIEGTLLAEEIALSSGKRIPHLWLALDPDNDTLTTSIFLPVLLYNLTEYLLKDDFPRFSYLVGHPGLSALWKAHPPATAGFHDVPRKPGVKVAVNLQSPSEAALKPAQARKPTQAQNTGRSLKEQSSSPWQTILSVAFVVFLGEWYLFMRRT